MGMIYGLIAALSWGVSDFLAQRSTQRLGALRPSFYVQVMGSIALTVTLLITGDFGRLLAHSDLWPFILLTSVFSASGVLAFYQAFRIGPLSIVSPVAATYGAVTAALSFFTGSSLVAVQWAGIVLILAGVVVSSIPPAQTAERVRQPRSGMAWAVLASCIWGVNFWVLGEWIVPEVGPLAPVWAFRTFGAVIITGVALAFRQSLWVPVRAMPSLVPIGILETIAITSLSIGTAVADVAIVTVISSLFSVITIGLAYVLLRERVAMHQFAAVGAVLVGIGLVNAS